MNEIKVKLSERILSFFEKYTEKVTFSEKRWFNRGFLPLYNYYVEIDNLYSTSVITYENRSSGFSETSSTEGSAFNDMHRINIRLISKYHPNYPTFEIKETSILKKVFSKKNYFVKTNDSNLVNELESNLFLQKFYNNQDSEFSPIFKSELVKGKYTISVLFNLKRFDAEVLDAIISFLNDFDKKLR